MTSLKPLPWSPVEPRPPWTYPLRRAAAIGLRGASAVLARLARRMALPAPAPRPIDGALSRLEFYADASAPEGALYLDGKLIGWLPRVTRL
jgi:hypothetical protein